MFRKLGLKTREYFSVSLLTRDASGNIRIIADCCHERTAFNLLGNQSWLSDNASIEALGFRQTSERLTYLSEK